MLLRQVDRWLGLTKQLAGILPERRNPLLIQHSQESLLRQRIYGLALGYEDLNGYDALRQDLLWQTATDRTEALGSCSTRILIFPPNYVGSRMSFAPQPTGCAFC